MEESKHSKHRHARNTTSAGSGVSEWVQVTATFRAMEGRTNKRKPGYTKENSSQVHVGSN